MDTPTNYLIATSVCLAFAYLIYLLFFRKETNFRQRRFFLIFAAVFSLLLPTGSYYILLPLTTNAETQTEVIAPSPVSESPVPQIASSDFHSVNPGSVPDTEPVKKRHSIDLLQALQYLYIAGVIVLLLRFIVQLVTISIWYSRSRKVKQPLFTLLFHERFSTPFSFFKWIFLTEKRLPETDFEKIIAHESVHVKQRHSFDAVFFELLCIFMWFNPFVWMMRRSINLTHEFLADEGAIQSGIDSLHYQALMVNQVAEANIVSVTSHFNKSLLSQRIKMIANSRLYKKAKYKILVLAPVALVLFLFIAGVNGLDQRKVLYRNLKKDPVISKVFSKDEIKDLVELRLMTDDMVVNVTGEPDTKIAYQKFNESLSSKSTKEVMEAITVPHDSLVVLIKSSPALLHIYDVSNASTMNFSLNLEGKVIEFLRELSKRDSIYSDVLNGIEIAGDISPSNISSFIKEPEKYNMESEAERLYASVIYGFLSNPIIKRNDKFHDNKAVELNSKGGGIILSDPEGALDLFNQALEIEPNLPTALMNSVNIYIKLHEFEEAKQRLRKLTELRSEEPEYWRVLGLVYDLEGDTQNAMRMYEKSFQLYEDKLDANDSEKLYIVKLNLASLYMLMGNVEKGRELYDDLKRENPDRSDFIDALKNSTKEEMLSDLQGDYKKSPKFDTAPLRLRFSAYQKNPSDRNAELLYEALPENGHPKLDAAGRETVAEIADNLGILENQVLKEQRNSVKVAFRMFTISDGAFTEWLQIMLGNLITINPKMFLEELKVHRHLFRVLPFYNLGPDYVDRLDERIDEYKLRIAALETVSADELTDVKRDCIGLLEKRSTPFERYKLKKDSKPEPNITIVNKSDYSPGFIESIRNSSFRGSNILLESNKFILENDSVSYYFPDYIPIGESVILSGKYRNVKIDLSFKRINQSSIDYAFHVYKGENKITENTGTAHLSPFFWLGLEMDFDWDIGKEFKYEEFKDDGVGVSIRIGQEDNGDLKAKILYGTPSEEFYIDRNNSPVLKLLNLNNQSQGSSTKEKQDARNSMYGGTFQYGNPSAGEAYGVIKIHPISDEVLMFYLEAGRGKPSYNSGALSGYITMLNTNQGLIQTKDDNLDCKLLISFDVQANSLNIRTMNGECGFGGGVSADGKYDQINSAIPEGFIDRSGREVTFNQLMSDLNKRGGGQPFTPEIIILSEIPKLNSYLDDSIRQASNNIGRVISSGQISPSIKIKYDGIIFDIAWDLDNRVNDIMTTDPNFSTTDGVKINMTLKELKNLQDIKIVKMPGWGYYAELNSGWGVGFSVDETMTGRELVDSDSVKWIFKKPGFRTKTTSSQKKDNQQGAEKDKSNRVSENAEVIINDPDNYSTDFMAGLYNLPEEYKKIEVRREILILNDTIFETLPDFLFSGKNYKMEGTDDNVEVKLSFTQNTYSSIDYVLR